MFKKPKSEKTAPEAVHVEPRRMTFVCEVWHQPNPSSYLDVCHVHLSCGNLAANGRGWSFGNAFDSAFRTLCDLAALERFSEKPDA